MMRRMDDDPIEVELVLDRTGTVVYFLEWHCRPPREGQRFKALDEQWRSGDDGDAPTRKIYRWEGVP